MTRRTLLPLFMLSLLVLSIAVVTAQEEEAEPLPPALLTDPLLQMPTEDGVSVVWFTEFEGSDHSATVAGESFAATTMKMSRTAEDDRSFVGTQNGDGSLFEGYTLRDVWRHEAVVTGLTAGERVPYFVTSIADDGTEIQSDEFTLQPLPAPGQATQLLFTSDHQLRDMTPANLQIVEETMGTGTIDAVLFPGDLQNIPDRASEWFDDSRGRGFFPGLQGNAASTIDRTRMEGDFEVTVTRTYTGGEIIQHAPLLPAVGNHEVMGRLNEGNGLGTQYNDPQPRAVAEARYEELADIVNPTGDPAIREQWIINNSFNSITYEELFTLPDDSPGGETYWSMAYGDVYIISMYTTRIWRTFGLGDNARGKYREPLADLNTPDDWGYGDFIFVDFQEGTDQYNWLVSELESEAFQNARYKIVLMHQGAHGLGDNVNPVMAHPVQVIDYDDAGRIEAVRYEYPLEDDIVFRDIVPLFNDAGVDLVLNGHSHVWWRMQNEAGVNFMESSNVGNSFGCYLEGYRERTNASIPINDGRFNADNYTLFGDPHGLEPIFPSVFSPQQDDEGNDLPCVNTNDLTVFTVFDTETGVVSSYAYDVTDPSSEAQIFDEFTIGS